MSEHTPGPWRIGAVADPRESTTAPSPRWEYARAVLMAREAGIGSSTFDRLLKLHATNDRTLDVLRRVFATDEIHECSNCGSIVESVTIVDDNSYCDECDDIWTSCDRCGDIVSADDVTATQDDQTVCDTCRDRHYTMCAGCDGFSPYATTEADGDSYCATCRDRLLDYCDTCEKYYVSGSEAHQHGYCDCEAPHQRFTFPNNGDGTVANDERFTLTLPAGIISDEGMQGIARLVGGWHKAVWDEAEARYGYVPPFPKDATGNSVAPGMDWDSIDHRWQTKEGNFPKRLARAMHRRNGYRMSPELMSAVGNIARVHATRQGEYSCELTRHLNLPPEDFGHEGSCWWGSYGDSRCALKQCGGLGLRVFDDDGEIVGRVWIMPLDANLRPTHDTMGAHAYVTFNAYHDGDNVGGVDMARLVAHMTGKTYRHIEFKCDPMYVNCGGYLIADAATIEANESLSLHVGVNH